MNLFWGFFNISKYLEIIGMGMKSLEMIIPTNDTSLVRIYLYGAMNVFL